MKINKKMISVVESKDTEPERTYLDNYYKILSEKVKNRECYLSKFKDCRAPAAHHSNL